jgi:hypothetical protein
MRIQFRRASLVVLVTIIGWLSFSASNAQAHPHLVGKWQSPTPPGGLMTLEFGPGCYMGNGVWRGPFFHVVSGVPASAGMYELRMYTGTQGALCLRDNVTAPGWTVGIVDFAAPAVNYMNVTYKR